MQAVPVLAHLPVGRRPVLRTVAGRDDVRDGGQLRRLIEEVDATMMQATPAGWRLLVDAGWHGRPAFRAVSGGEPLPVDLAEALLDRCGEVWNGYGPTETTVYSTYWRVSDPREGIYIGRPIANTTVHILDERGNHCPLGVPGEILIGEMNCVACHEAAPALKERLDSRQSPKLGAEGLRLTPQWLRAFLTDPQSETRGTLMPDMLHALPPKEKAEAADALTHFLVSLQPEDEPTQVGASSSGIKAGGQLYHSVGCVMCHAPFDPPKEKSGDAAAIEEMKKLTESAVPLGDLARKYSVGDLALFLRDPLRTLPSGRMPSLKLNDGEARAIAMYLLRTQVPAGASAKLAGLAYEYYEKGLPELPEFDRLTPDASASISSEKWFLLRK